MASRGRGGLATRGDDRRAHSTDRLRRALARRAQMAIDPAGPARSGGKLAQLPNGRVTGLRLARTRGPPAGELVGGGSLGGSPGGTQPGSLVGRAVSIVRSRCTISKHILAEITPGLGGPPLPAWSIGGLHEAAALASRQVPDFWSPDGQPTQAVASEAGRGRNPGWPRPAVPERATRGSQPACRFGRIPAGATSSAPSEARRSGLQSGSTRVRRCAGRVFT